MATLVNRDVVVKDTDACLIVGRCVGQSATDDWIKVLRPNGSHLMAKADDFVRVADPDDAQIAVVLRGIEGATKLLTAAGYQVDSSVMNHLAIAKSVARAMLRVTSTATRKL